MHLILMLNVTGLESIRKPTLVPVDHESFDFHRKCANSYKSLSDVIRGGWEFKCMADNKVWVFTKFVER